MSLSRYWHTLRHLRARQVCGRLWFRAYQPAPNLAPAPPVRRATTRWEPVGWRDPSLLDATAVRFLGVAGDASTASAWSDGGHGRLWLYNLHYFDDLTARGCEERREWHRTLVTRWIEENAPGTGAGWEPYPTSLRIANWIKWVLAGPTDGRTTVPAMTESLAVQTRWLSKRLEFHLLGNHLWANAKALLMAGLFFDGPEADAWRKKGEGLLRDQLDEQILADGGHFERSPMYHAILLEDVLDLVQIAGLFPGVMPLDLVDRLRGVASRMLRWLRVMTHPDGEVAFFNDAAFGIAAPCRVLETYARSVGVLIAEEALEPVVWLRESGYVRLANARAVVLCDVAPVGPDYQPGHAHADTLSFEMSLDGRRIIVNGGTSTYTAGPERARQRATASHSTVEVDGQNSSDVWGGFRVARRARPLDVRAGVSGGALWVEAAHDGYRHRIGRVTHHRSWRLESHCLSVTDTLSGRFERAVARFILHPDARTLAPAVFEVSCAPPASSACVATRWHPEFGKTVDTRAVEVAVAAPQTTTSLRWS